MLTFATVGDSRQDPSTPDSTTIDATQVNVGNCNVPSGTGLTANKGLSGQDCKWLQNSKAWSRIMRHIQAQGSNLLFFNGDMIMGYGKAGVPVTRNGSGTGEVAITNPAVSDIVNSDLMQFYRQYGFWRGMVATLMETGTYVVPVPGNHEVQCKRCGKKAQVENELSWIDNMGDLILDQNRFNSLLNTTTANTHLSTTAPSASDNITSTADQTKLNYSFDIGANHFAIINTDPVGNDGNAPVNWLDSDLSAAKSRGAKNMYVFGHKAAFYYSFGNPPSTSAPLLNNADAFWNVITTYKATYFCGHEHIYNVNSFIGSNGKPGYQVLVGAGGSPFEAAKTLSGLKATDRMYSFAMVRVHKSGKAVLRTFGFDDTMTGALVPLEVINLPSN